MTRFAPWILFFCGWSAAAMAADRKEEAECARIDREIREVQAEMRHGYPASKGEKLKARLRELRARRAKLCR